MNEQRHPAGASQDQVQRAHLEVLQRRLAWYGTPWEAPAELLAQVESAHYSLQAAEAMIVLAQPGA